MGRRRTRGKLYQSIAFSFARTHDAVSREAIITFDSSTRFSKWRLYVCPYVFRTSVCPCVCPYACPCVRSLSSVQRKRGIRVDKVGVRCRPSLSLRQLSCQGSLCDEQSGVPLSRPTLKFPICSFTIALPVLLRRRIYVSFTFRVPSKLLLLCANAAKRIQTYSITRIHCTLNIETDELYLRLVPSFDSGKATAAVHQSFVTKAMIT